LEFARDIAEAEGIAEVASRAVAHSARILGSPSATLWLQDAASGDLVPLAGVPEDDDQGLASIPVRLLTPWLGRSEPYLVGPDDYDSDSSPLENTGGRFAVAPLAVNGRWGVIAAAIPHDSGFGGRELELLGGLAQQTRLALQSAESYETLERTFLSTVEALANALEANDERTSTHARWITDLALKVGVDLGLEPKALKRLELGALFHDIGKIGIPASILTKPGPLTPEEQGVIETHPLLGERILAPIEQLEPVRRIVRSAHERWDGLGYPDHLAGDEIPIESRIVLACDAFHAMTTDRPYRGALGAEDARRRLEDASGSQFDPAVVDALLRVLDDADNASYNL
ncbi:MAG: HD domain-containing phosphohydrolase, partial [Gaiellaceae bacterium]